MNIWALCLAMMYGAAAALYTFHVAIKSSKLEEAFKDVVLVVGHTFWCIGNFVAVTWFIYSWVTQ